MVSPLESFSPLFPSFSLSVSLSHTHTCTRTDRHTHPHTRTHTHTLTHTHTHSHTHTVMRRAESRQTVDSTSVQHNRTEQTKNGRKRGMTSLMLYVCVCVE